MSIIDELTNTYNYRGLVELGAREVERARRFNRLLAALFFDIDAFKMFNDKYSHATGNLVLKEVAVRCRSILRSVDIIARYGGDEFVVLLPEASLPIAREVAHRLRRGIASAKIDTDYGKLGVTISVGLTALTKEIPDFITLIDCANQAEHTAKLKGNCVCSYKKKRPTAQAGISPPKNKP
jgi:diguanylate cyclase (GGDEF)-like protein